MKLTLETLIEARTNPVARTKVNNEIAEYAKKVAPAYVRYQPKRHRNVEALVSELYLTVYSLLENFAMNPRPGFTPPKFVESRLIFDRTRIACRSVSPERGTYADGRAEPPVRFCDPIDGAYVKVEAEGDPALDAEWAGVLEEILRPFDHHQRLFILDWIESASSPRRTCQYSLGARHGLGRYETRKVLERLRHFAGRFMV